MIPARIREAFLTRLVGLLTSARKLRELKEWQALAHDALQAAVTAAALLGYADGKDDALGRTVGNEAALEAEGMIELAIGNIMKEAREEALRDTETGGCLPPVQRH